MAIINLILLIVICVIWMRKTQSRAFPLIVGVIAYMFLSVLRGMARMIVLNEGVREHVWQFYILSALLSGVFEEVGRYVVFRWCIPNHDRWTDCVAYAIGHCAIEEILMQSRTDIGFDIFGGLFNGYLLIHGVLFSVAMTVLVFATVHYTFHHKLLLLAVGLHTIVDILPALCLNDVITMGEYDFLDFLYLIGVCYLAYRVFCHYHPKEAHDE